MLESIFIFFLGLAIGIASGIIPGLHPNLISAIVIAQDMDFSYKAMLIVAIYSGHMIFSSVPSVFFGIPDERTAVSVLPGHRLSMEGKGMLALKVIAFSALIASLASIIMLPIADAIYPIAYPALRPYIIWILCIGAAMLIFRSKKPLLAALVFLASGLLGAYTLNSGMNDSLLPLFSGFFAIGAILNYKKGESKKQFDDTIDLGCAKYALLGAVLGGFANLIPAMSSPAQIAVFASAFIMFESQNYLAAVTGINAGQFIFAFSSSVAIGKARHGVIAQLGDLVDLNGRTAELATIFLIGIGISALLLYILRNKMSALSALDFSIFNKLIAAYIIGVVFLLDGVFGLGVLLLSSIIGYLAIRMDVERTVMMGAIIVPTLMLIY